MRIDSLAPRTRLLAVVAVLGVLAVIVAVIGLGRSDRPADLHASNGLDLPRWGPPPAQRLKPLAEYAEMIERPLFFEGRRPVPFFIPGPGGKSPTGFQYRLTSVLISPDLRIAILTGEGGDRLRVREGESLSALPAWRLQKVQERSAVLVGPAGSRTLELLVFNGVGGEPPTVLSTKSQNVTSATSPPVPSGRPAGSMAAGTLSPEHEPSTVAPSAETDPRLDEIRQRVQARRKQAQEQARPSTPTNKTQ